MAKRIWATGFVSMCMMIFGCANAQTAALPWQQKLCAVVLTYDDAIEQQLDNALPVLDSLGLKATFYLTANNAMKHIDAWRAAAARGHELGNHTLFHPCNGGEGRQWVQPENDLRSYTVQRIENEIRMTNGFLEALDGKKERSFAYTCGDTRVQDSLFINGLKNDFVAARGVVPALPTIDKVDLYNVSCYGVSGQTAAQMEAWVQEAKEKKALLVILFHGVGGGNGLDVSVQAHRAFLQYLQQNQQDIWVAPMVEVANYIKAAQGK